MAHTATDNGPLACQFDWGDGWLAATVDGESVCILKNIFELLDLGYLNLTTERSSWANIKPQEIIDTILTPILERGGTLDYVHQRSVGRIRLQEFGKKPLTEREAGITKVRGSGVLLKKLDDAIDATVIHDLTVAGRSHSWPTEVKMWGPAANAARDTYIWWSKRKWREPQFQAIWKSLPSEIRKHPACKHAIVAIAYLASSATANRDEFSALIGANEFGYANVFRANYERAMFAAQKQGVTKQEYLQFLRQLGSRFYRERMALHVAANGPSSRHSD